MNWTDRGRATDLNRTENSTTQPPVVSIGFAVYNGEKYMSEAIESLLRQTFENLELIICDNASTDSTESIARGFAASDGRVRYVRNDTNIGGARNENKTFRLSRGKYFRLAADDDVCDPELIERCVTALELAPDAVLCATYIRKIDEFGDQTGDLMPLLGTATSPSRRFRELYTLQHDCELTYGLIRSSVLARTDLQMNYTDSDRTLLCELALHGRFVIIPEFLFSKRYHPGMSTQVFPDWYSRMRWFDSSYDDDHVLMPHWEQLTHYLRIIARAPISFTERRRCFTAMASWLVTENRWRDLRHDILVTAKRLMRRGYRTIRPRSTPVP